MSCYRIRYVADHSRALPDWASKQFASREEAEALIPSLAEQQDKRVSFFEVVPTALATPDGQPIVAWGTYGITRGYGPLRTDRKLAEHDLQSDQTGCRASGGYSDRRLVAVDSAGICWLLESGEIWTWAPRQGGRTSGAARYDLSEVAS